MKCGGRWYKEINEFKSPVINPTLSPIEQVALWSLVWKILDRKYEYEEEIRHKGIVSCFMAHDLSSKNWSLY